MSYLSKITLKPTLDARRLFVKEQIKPRGLNNRDSSLARNRPDYQQPYRVHQVLWQLFDLPTGSKRPFLYREYQRGGQTFYYMLSTLKPKQNHPFFHIQSKAFEPKFFKGQRLAFELRANPVVYLNDSQGKSNRHDVLMIAKRSMIEQGFTDPYSIDQAMFEAGVNWITNSTRMQQWGVIIHPKLELSAYTQHKLRRSRDNKKNQGNIRNNAQLIQFSSLDYEGALEIQDANIFYEQMLKGFGKQKAFGCGLMLVRPLR